MGASDEENRFVALIKGEIWPFREHARKGWPLMPVPDPSRKESVRLAIDKVLPGHKVYFLNISELMKKFNQFKTCVSNQVLSNMFGVFIKGSIGKSFGSAIDGKFRKELVELLGPKKFDLLLNSFMSRPSDNKDCFGNIIWDVTAVHIRKFPEFVGDYWKNELQRLTWESITYLLLYKTGFSILNQKTENSAKFKTVCAYLPLWIPICIKRDSKEVVLLAR